MTQRHLDRRVVAAAAVGAVAMLLASAVLFLVSVGLVPGGLPGCSARAADPAAVGGAANGGTTDRGMVDPAGLGAGAPSGPSATTATTTPSTTSAPSAPSAHAGAASMGGGCGDLVSGRFGRDPVLGLPWSQYGVVWSTQLLALCLLTCVRRSPADIDTEPTILLLRWSARGGALLSLGFLCGLWALGTFCPWCAVVHAGSLWVFVWLEFAWRSARRCVSTASGQGLGDAHIPTAPLATWAVVAVASLAATIVLERLGAQSRAAAVAEAEAAVAAAIGGTGIGASNAAPDGASRRLQGRHAIGPADAPIEIVVFSDYQCPDCRRIDGEIEAALVRGDVRFTPKHMPLASDCNPLVERSLHPDACRRAAMAEAAGRLGGAAAFHAAHRALFKVAASGGDPFDAVLEATGLSRDELDRAMSSPEVAAAIRSDVDDAVALGVTFTPMVFVNGVEWKWYAGGSGQRSTLGEVIARAVGTQRATPPDAVEKLVDDWARVRALPNLAVRLPGDLPRRPQDEADGSSQSDAGLDRSFVVVYLDYAVEGSRILDSALMRLGEEGVHFTWIVRPFPASSACNEMSGLPSTASSPCDLARIVVAADAAGGTGAARRAHEILLRDAVVDADGIAAIESEVAGQLERTTAASEWSSSSAAASSSSAAASSGPDAVARFREALAAPSTLVRIRAQAASLHRHATVRSVPTLVVDGRMVPRWEHPGAPPDAVLRGLLTRAALDRRGSRAP